jgi:transposase
MISIPLDWPDVRVLDTAINDPGEIMITVESNLKGRRCQHCQQQIEAFHQADEWITLRHQSILGRPVYIRLRPKRYNCAWCARRKGKKKVTTTQQLSWHWTWPYESVE